MLEFVRKNFRGLVSFILWINLIGCAIAGAVVGVNVGANNAAIGMGIIGFLIGGVAGGVFSILGGGMISVILNIDENLEKLVKDKTPRSQTSIPKPDDYRWKPANITIE